MTPADPGRSVVARVENGDCLVTPASATIPPGDLPGLDPRWSRLVDIIDGGGQRRTFHLLDSWVDADGSPRTDEPVGTLLCVHGNPTWSYLWRRMVAAAPPGWRVVAPDHLGMGYSERPAERRVLDERVGDLTRLTAALGVTGPVVTLAHDWGGIISLGWALQHREQLRGVVLTNTAVHQPAGDRGPLLIRLAAAPGINALACRWTPLFVRATTSLTWPRLPAAVRDAFAGPYRSPGRRRAVAEFVADIPFAPGHPSNAAVQAIADGVAVLTVPALLLWGPRDPVFSDVYLRDLQGRLPQAAVHRYELASHLLPEDAPGYAESVAAWLGELDLAPDPGLEPDPGPTPDPEPAAGEPTPSGGDDWGRTAPPGVLHALDSRAEDDAVAVVEVGGASISWRELHTRVQDIAAGLVGAGLAPGARVALLVPPSIELTVALYAVWRAGGVIVVADKGLGLRGMGRALRGARLDALIADTAGLLAARGMRLPGRRFAVRENVSAIKLLGRVDDTLPALARVGHGRAAAPDADPDEEAAVLFTSGATGPAKGVLYLHRQVRAQLALIRSSYALTPDDRIVAAFAPFALYGPALGIPSVVPRTDVTRPGRLTAAALADAALALHATVVFASPAALRNVVRTAPELTAAQRAALADVRLLMSAGASVPVRLLRQVQQVLPDADLHTPYGMTEALPLTDVSLAQILEAGDGDGVCVGKPLAGVQIRIAALGPDGEPAAGLTAEPGVTGEIWARAPHIRQRYDASWVVDLAAHAHPGWHRTGDVGQLDDHGRLWVQGRSVHVITTAAGPVTPVGIELRVESRIAEQPGLPAYQAAAAVGVGPTGTQQVVVVLEGAGDELAPASVTALVRAAAGVPVAAVLVTGKLPVDIRHNSKIDRAAVGRWATGVLAAG